MARGRQRLLEAPLGLGRAALSTPALRGYCWLFAHSAWLCGGGGGFPDSPPPPSSWVGRSWEECEVSVPRGETTVPGGLFTQGASRTKAASREMCNVRGGEFTAGGSAVSRVWGQLIKSLLRGAWRVIWVREGDRAGARRDSGGGAGAMEWARGRLMMPVTGLSTRKQHSFGGQKLALAESICEFVPWDWQRPERPGN